MGTKAGLTAAIACACVLTASRLEAAKCTIDTTSVIFGSYNVFASAPVDSTGSVRYNCNGGAKNVQITITRGRSATFLQRSLRRGADNLGYNLFLDPSRTAIWGDGTGGSHAYYGGNPPNKTDVNVTIYGRIPPGQDVGAGKYSDNVVVAIDF
jgi:spore coat protein U-like protein